MKRLITLSGPGGRAVLELGEEIKLSVSKGKLYLADKQGNIHPRENAPADTVGAFVAEGGRILMQGSLAGYSATMAKARTALMMSLSGKKEAAQGSRFSQERPSPKQTQQAQPPRQQTPTQPDPQPKSAALLEILQKAAELFPPEQPLWVQPPAQPERNDAVVNPFPEAFPFSRWRRVEYPGTDRCYLEGEARHRGVDYVIHALPGDRRHGGPPGYTRFLRARDGSGFWVRVRRR